MEVKKVRLISFGYKYNNNPVADIVYNISKRLINPYNKYPHLCGLDNTVKQFVLTSKGAEELVDSYVNYIDSYINLHIKDEFSIAIGCYGGKHRSVVIVEEVGRRLRERGFEVEILHRELEKV